jgi:hypothetical protein
MVKLFTLINMINKETGHKEEHEALLKLLDNERQNES